MSAQNRSVCPSSQVMSAGRGASNVVGLDNASSALAQRGHGFSTLAQCGQRS